MDNLRVWQFLTAALTLSLLMSWSYFQFVSMLNDAAMENLSHVRSEVRRLDNQVAILNTQLSDLRSQHRSLGERVENYNQQRVRDHELVMANQPRPLVRTVR
jgi:peptidoglycan hydrolase CwlO-like protein